MAPVLSLAVTAHREVSLVRQLREYLKHALTIRRLHFATVTSDVFDPSLIRKRLREGPLYQLRAGREFWKPDIEVVSSCIIRFTHASWGSSYCAQSKGLSRRPRTA